MATYDELSGIRGDGNWNTFQSKVRIAVLVKATAVIDSATPPASALDWAKNALQAPGQAADGLIEYIVIANKSAAISAILGATDSAIQANIDAAVDALYGG